jgi:hypothetical protein
MSGSPQQAQAQTDRFSDYTNVFDLLGTSPRPSLAGRTWHSGVDESAAISSDVSSRGETGWADGQASDTVALAVRSDKMVGMEPDHVTPRELAAELKAIEERMDRRQAEIGGRIELLAQSLDSFAGRITENVGRIETSAGAVSQDLERNFNRLDAKISAVQDKSSQDKRQILLNLWVIVIGAFLAGLAAIWTTNSLIISATQLKPPIQAATPGEPR